MCLLCVEPKNWTGEADHLSGRVWHFGKTWLAIQKMCLHFKNYSTGIKCQRRSTFESQMLCYACCNNELTDVKFIDLDDSVMQ